MPRISVDLPEELYKELHAMKYSLSDTGSTHAAVMREALRLLVRVRQECKAGLVVGTASGKGQRLRHVLASHGGYRLELDL